MKDLVHSFRMYSVWEYEKEEQDLNAASKNGLQLIRGGCFRSLFKYDDSVRYIYQLDYNPGIGDMDRYQELFADRHWEYINSTFNGWHYFRKPYSEGMSADDTRIYTDRQSLTEMQNRYTRGLSLLFAVYVITAVLHFIFMLRSFSLYSLAQSFCMFGVLFVIGYGLHYNHRRQKGKAVLFPFPLRILMPSLLLLLFLQLILAFFSS